MKRANVNMSNYIEQLVANSSREKQEVALANIEKPGPNDVLCGRGGGSQNHNGNKEYRVVIAANKRRYIEASRDVKRLLVETIVNAVRLQIPSGRFLEKGEDGLWYDIGDKRAFAKTCQAIREGAPKIRQDMASNVNRASITPSHRVHIHINRQDMNINVDSEIYDEVESGMTIHKCTQDAMSESSSSQKDTPLEVNHIETMHDSSFMMTEPEDLFHDCASLFNSYNIVTPSSHSVLSFVDDENPPSGLHEKINVKEMMNLPLIDMMDVAVSEDTTDDGYLRDFDDSSLDQYLNASDSLICSLKEAI